MHTRLLTSVAAFSFLVLAPVAAAALVPELPVCGSCSADVNTAEPAPAAGAREVTAQPQPVMPEMPICAYCGADAQVGGANGGIWKTSDGAAAPVAPSEVQAAPSEASLDYYIRLEDVEGEAAEGAQGAPQPGVQAQSEQARIGLLLPAVQKVREAASRTQDDGVVVLDGSPPPGGAAARGTGTLTLSSGGAAVMPEQPVCAHCGAHAEAQAPETAAEEAPRRRRMPNFSVSFGGVTIGSGGVSVAAGDVTGDSRSETSRSERRSDSGASRSSGRAERRR